jgi:transcriptional regulator with XRE-family HTH domain
MPRSLTTHIDAPREVGIRLKAARERSGLSQRRLSFPGCTAAYISRIEAGDRVPSLQMIDQLALRLEVPGQWLATGVVAEPAEPPALVDAEIALRLGEVDRAERLYRDHLQPGDPVRAAALAGLGRIAFRNGQTSTAIELLEQALDARRGSTLADPGAVEALGRAYASAGAVESAIALLERALAEAVEASASLEQLRFSVLLADTLLGAGALARAGQVLAEAVRVAAGSDDRCMSARSLWSQARLHSGRGEPALAGRYARLALAALEQTEIDARIALAYELAARVASESA